MKILAWTAVILLAACSADSTRYAGASESTDPAPSAPEAPNEATYHPRLQEIAQGYREWARVDDLLHWAPTLCRLPPPSVARMSASRDDDTHGRKLYTLFARHRDAYPGILGEPRDAPVGQVIVKESWVPIPVADEDVPERTPDLLRGMILSEEPDPHTVDLDFYPYALRDGKVYRAGEQGPLFVMLKLDPATPGTDQGWVYATVEIDGRVTSAGRVAACMDCHVDAPHDRQFGLAEAPWAYRPMKELLDEDSGR